MNSASDPLAQLVARFLDMEEVTGSSPVGITNFFNTLHQFRSVIFLIQFKLKKI